MTHRFISNILLVVGINLLIKPLYIFGIDRTVQNDLGPMEYGLFFALFNFTYLFQILNDLGLQNYNHTIFSQHPQLIPKYLPKILGVKMLLALVFIIVTVVAGFLFGYLPRYTNLLALIIFNQILISGVLLLRTNLSASGYYAWDSILSALDKALLILLLGYWLYFSDWTLTVIDFVKTQTTALVITLLTAYSLIQFKVSVHGFRSVPNQAFISSQLRRSIPFATIILLMTLYTRMDAVMIERILPDGQEEAGIYAASYRILDASNMLGLLFAGLLLPMIAKNLKDPLQVRSLISTATSLLMAASITMVSASYFFGSELISLLYEHATPYWTTVFRTLMPSYLGISAIYIYGTYLTAAQEVRKMNKVFLIGVLINFLLNLFLIKMMKAQGAALATLLTQSGTACALIWISHKSLSWPLFWSDFVKILPFPVLLILIIMGLRSTELPWFVQLIIFVLIALVTSVYIERNRWKTWIRSLS